MNSIKPTTLSTAVWIRLLVCAPLVLAMGVAAALRSSHLESQSLPESALIVEMACWRIALLMSFHSAPLTWARFIYRGYRNSLIPFPLHQAMTRLRMPLATWTAGCLVIAIALWPALNP
jgi:hypothetical protein